MASNAAVPFWRAAGMTYITYSNICANLVRNCLKEPHRSEVLNREKVHFSVSKWVDGRPEKPSKPRKRDYCQMPDKYLAPMPRCLKVEKELPNSMANRPLKSSSCSPQKAACPVVFSEGKKGISAVLHGPSSISQLTITWKSLKQKFSSSRTSVLAPNLLAMFKTNPNLRCDAIRSDTSEE